MPASDMPLAEVSIDSDLVRGLLLDQHPELAGEGLAEVASGWDNVIYRLGEDWLVRLPRREVAAQLVLNEQRWLPELAPRLPLPIPVPARIGRPGRGYPWSWSVCPWFEGETAAEAALDLGRAALDLGAFVLALHSEAPAEAPRNEVRGVPLIQREPALLESTGTPLAQEFGWLSDLVPLLAKLPNKSVRGAAARLVEKHYLLRKLSPHLPSELAEPIEQVLQRAVELSVVLSEVDALFDEIVSSGSERSLDDNRRAALMTLSDRRASLGRHLAQATHLFNRLAGEAVASSTDHGDVTPEILDEAQKALEQHIDVSREVRRELEAFS